MFAGEGRVGLAARRQTQAGAFELDLTVAAQTEDLQTLGFEEGGSLAAVAGNERSAR
ncbi:hypothetical protein D3C78_1826950 [compost metagenome]